MIRFWRSEVCVNTVCIRLFVCPLLRVNVDYLSDIVEFGKQPGHGQWDAGLSYAPEYQCPQQQRNRAVRP